MAVIAEMRIMGALVRIHDDAYANCTPEEIARRKRERNIVAGQILNNMARRMAEREAQQAQA
jgi:hypothetical protein